MGKNDNCEFYDKELIWLVKINECLYDKKMQKNCTPAMMEDMWLQLGHMLHQNNIPIVDPKKRWNQLRTNFIRNHTNGKTNWHLYDHLSFLIGTYNPKKNRDNQPYAVNTSGCHASGFTGNSSSSSFSYVGGFGHTSQAVDLIQADGREANTSLNFHNFRTVHPQKQELNFLLPTTSTNLLTATEMEIVEETSENLEKKHSPFLKYELLTIPEEVILLDDDDDVPNIPLPESTSLYRASPSRQLLQSESSGNSTSTVSNVHSFVDNEPLASASHQPMDDTSNKENINFSTREPVTVDSREKDFHVPRFIVPEGREDRQFSLNVHDLSAREVFRDTMNRRKSSNRPIIESIVALSNPLRSPGTSHQEDFINCSASERILESERVVTADGACQSSNSFSYTSTTKRPTILNSNEVGKNTVKSFTSCPVSGRFKRVAEIIDEHKRSNPTMKDSTSKRIKSKVIVPPLDKFAQDKKVQQKNAKENPVKQAIIRSADDIHTATEHLTNLMKLKVEVLKKQLTEKEEKRPNHVPLVEGDALFNLFRHQWLQLSEKHRNESFCEVLDVIESFQCEK